MATVMLEGGADIPYIQQMLGHTNITSTQLYTQVSLRRLAAVHAATHPGASNQPRRHGRGNGGGAVLRPASTAAPGAAEGPRSRSPRRAAGPPPPGSPAASLSPTKPSRSPVCTGLEVGLCARARPGGVAQRLGARSPRRSRPTFPGTRCGTETHPALVAGSGHSDCCAKASRCIYSVQTFRDPAGAGGERQRRR